MEPILVLFLHLVVLVLVFALLVWVVQIVTALLPPPLSAPVRAVLLVLLALLAIAVLCGEAGLWGTWGFGYRRRGL